jgi:prepilin peptidase CpaA
LLKKKEELLRGWAAKASEYTVTGLQDQACPVDILLVLSTLHPSIVAALTAITVVAAFTDIKARTIPNWLVAPGLAVGFGLNILLYGWSGLSAASLGFGLALLIYVPLFILRAMGGGDVKLMAAVGCLAGPHNWFTIFVLTSLAGGAYALLLLVARRSMGGALWNILHIVKEVIRLKLPFRSKPELDIGHSKALSVPHAVSIAAGTFLFLYAM